MDPINNNIANISFICDGTDYILKMYDYEFNIPISVLRSGNIKFINDKNIMMTKTYTKVVGAITDLITISIVCHFNKKELKYFIEVICDNKKSFIKNY
jgi:hypothetical protein